MFYFGLWNREDFKTFHHQVAKMMIEGPNYLHVFLMRFFRMLMRTTIIPIAGLMHTIEVLIVITPKRLLHLIWREPAALTYWWISDAMKSFAKAWSIILQTRFHGMIFLKPMRFGWLIPRGGKSLPERNMLWMNIRSQEECTSSGHYITTASLPGKPLLPESSIDASQL